MRTRKLLLMLVIVTIGMVGCLSYVIPGKRQDDDKNYNGFSRNHYRYREENTSDGKDILDFLSLPNLSDEKNIRNKRAIDSSSSGEENSGRDRHQSGETNLANKVDQTETKKFSTKYNSPMRHGNVSIGNGICQSIDIRNDVHYLEILRPCRVIEGFLQIVLIENDKTGDLGTLRFPELREITGYLLLYRVNNLKSIGQLFPNLEVIHGDTVLADYSFMVYEMQNLQEIGLSKLIKISRGAVRIEKNPSLCYTTTLDWSAIVVAGENFIKDNKISTGTGKSDNCPGCTHCPGGHCWTAKDCQITDKPKCHPQCLGDCHGPTEMDCYVCKHYRHEGKCVESCPANLCTYLSRRCITKQECLNMNNLRKGYQGEDDKKWRPFNGSCVAQCPDRYEDFVDENNERTCRLCTGLCRKILHGAVIRHISDAQEFRGATVVKGALEFQIRNGNPNIINELTYAFGMIEEITEYLKITHSFSIPTLGFFKKLRVIKGEKLDINNASLVVLDNPNLSNLFPETQKIDILAGRFFFHYNPKLCLSKIKNLGKMVGITNFTEMEVQPDSNGEKVACDIVNINITVQNKGPNHAKLVWEVYKPSEGQRLLSYLLSYIETENENISYEGNSCGNNTWQIVDVEISRTDSAGSLVSKLIQDLKPYTKYAVYVKTLAARDKNKFSPTGQSKIIFFRTKPDIPSVPTEVISFAASDSEIIVKWGPPEEPNGPIGYYMISGFLRPDDADFLSSRNYCKNGLSMETEIEDTTDIVVKLPPVDPEQSCCQKNLPVPTVTNAKKFEIFCHDNMTISYLSYGRKNYCNSRYNMDSKLEFLELDDNNLSSPRSSVRDSSYIDPSKMILDDRKERIFNNTYYSFIFNVSSKSSSHLLNKLKHYSLYTISVAACGRKLDNGTEMCSSIQYTNSRTKKRKNADDVLDVKSAALNDTVVIVSWTAPRNPNGLTVAYNIEHTNVIVKDAKKTTECIQHIDYIKKQGAHYLRNLSPGRYSVRTRAISLAGEGTWSKTVYFTIGIKEKSTIMVIFLTICILLVGFIITICLIFRYHHLKKRQERLIANVNPDYIEAKYMKDDWEIDRSKLQILEALGNGNFGMVYRGILNGDIEVAVKTTKNDCTERFRNEFLNEASVMKNFSSYHILKLIGVVSEGNPPYVVMELMENGDLKTYLRRVRETVLAPNEPKMVRWAGEIADGMAYLEFRKFLHRDLAARNCLLSKKFVCKIGDFGMARDIYETDYYKIGDKAQLPIRWMSPENLRDGVYSSESDVWSYGVVLFEIMTLAEMPYQGLTNRKVYKHVMRKGSISNKPRNTNFPILNPLMERCLAWKPSERPTFMSIVAHLESFLGQDFVEKSFFHTAEATKVRAEAPKKVYHQPSTIFFNWRLEGGAKWVRDLEDHVTLLNDNKDSTSRPIIVQNDFQEFGNIPPLEDVPLDR